MTKFMNSNACCSDGTSIEEPESKDCLDKWKEKLKVVSNEYTEVAAITSKNKEEYQNSLSWESKLKNWDEIIKTSDVKASAVVTQLKFFREQTKIVCENAEEATKALGKLICLVKTIFDCFYTYSEGDEGLKEKISNFKKAIDCLKSVSDEDRAEVIICIEEYEAKIILVCEMQAAILDKLLETLKCANLLYASICGNGGLRDKVEGILEDFGGHLPDDDDEDCETSDDQGEEGRDIIHRKEYYHPTHHQKYPCNDKVAKPIPVFPIRRSRYYKSIEKEFGRAFWQTKKLEKNWISSKNHSDKVLSHKKSLIEAISAAEAAESAK